MSKSTRGICLTLDFQNCSLQFTFNGQIRENSVELTELDPLDGVDAQLIDDCSIHRAWRDMGIRTILQRGPESKWHLDENFGVTGPISLHF